MVEKGWEHLGAGILNGGLSQRHVPHHGVIIPGWLENSPFEIPMRK